jgi:hypothetical protein
MRAIVVYESMFGATRTIAESIAQGLGTAATVRVIRAADADLAALDGADLLVVGGPTHAWSMPRPRTRKGAPGYVRKPGSGLVLEPGADMRPGVREWLDALPAVPMAAAAFDTRFKAPSLFTGRASKAIARSLTRHGAVLSLPPVSFLVDKKSHLLAAETERARAWGARLASVSASKLTRNA